MALQTERPARLREAGDAPNLDRHLLRIIAGGSTRSGGSAATSQRQRADRNRRFLDALGVAVYTTDAGGRITFYNVAAAEFWGREPELGREATVEVLDRGIRFDEDAERHVFETFYRSESARKAADGLGIGQALAKLIVDAIGGRIWAGSRPGGGTVVGFALPISPGMDAPD